MAGLPPMRRMLCCASGWLRVGGSFRAAACLSVRGQGLVPERLHRPDVGKHHGAHQAGRTVRHAAAVRSSGYSGVQLGTLWRRGLGENRFSGSMPSTISALTALTYLYTRAPALPWVEFTASRLASAGVLGCRDLSGNRLEGRLPPSLLAMRIPRRLYAPPPVVCSRADDAESVLSPVQPVPARGLRARAVRT